MGEDPAEALTQTDLGEQTLDLKLGGTAQVQRNLETLAEAVLRRKRVAIKYYTIHRDETTTREVDPYGLGFAGQAWNKGAWYLVGHCHLRKGPRVFKVDRLRGGVKIVGAGDAPDFERPAGFNVRDHLNKARWEMRELSAALGGGTSSGDEDAIIRFDKAVATAIRELVPSAKVEEESSAGVLLRFRFPDRRAFCRFLLPYSEQLEIVSPRDLGVSLADLAREILGRYADTGGTSS